MSTTKLVRLTTKDHPDREELYEVHTDSEKSSNWWKTYMNKYEGKQRMFAWVMVILVIAESSFLFLQAGKGFATKSAKDVDLAAYIVLTVFNVIWFLYGVFVVKDFPIILSAVLFFIGCVLVLVTIGLYG
jgi:uncharacterized protein with PQ loop repeat